MEFNNECALLEEIYTGAVMGQESIRLLLPKVSSARFRSDLQTQNNQYAQTAQEADDALKAKGRCPQEPGEGKKLMLRMSVMANTMCNQETSHLAEMMIQGSNMGIISLTKVLNTCPGVQNPAVELAQRTLQQEEDNINRLKVYLQ